MARLLMGLYILDADGEPVRVTDTLQWGKWREDNPAHVAEDFIGEVRISTVFLGIDHAFIDGPPVLWETMVFGGKHDGYQDRYTSRDAALTGHAEAVALVRKTLS